MPADWVRITLLLPVTSPDDQTAFLALLNYIRSQHPAPLTDRPITGFTHSPDEPAAYYRGFYWSTQGLGQDRWVSDDIVILFTDRPGKLADIESVAQTLKATADRIYREEGSPQEEVWCTMQSLQLV